MKRSFWSVCLSLVLTSSLLLGACGNGNSDNKTPESSASTDANKGEASGKPASSGEQVVIRHTMYDTEFTSEMVAEFEKTHPNIKVELVSADYNKLMAMMAAGNGPDIIRTNSVTELPGFVLKGMALDLTSYFNESSVFKTDDFLPVVNQFRYDTATGVHGTGSLYGFPKDWSPDYTIYYNKKMFEAAGVPLPSSTDAMTWKQLVDLGDKLTIKNGKKVSQYGLVYFNGGTVANQDLLNLQLLQQGGSMYSSDFGKADLTTPQMKDLLQFWVDTAKSGVGPSPLHQETDWGGQLFVDNKAAIIIAGYWFSGFLKTNELTKDRLADFGVAPAPMMEGGKRISPTGAGTGAIIYKNSKHPKEAWEVFEWFFGGQPAEERAKAGYGLPGTKTLAAMLPQSTEFDKMNYDFIQNELQYTDGSLPYNPYLNYQAVNSIFDKYFTPVYFDKDTVDGASKKMTEELNTLITEGKQLVSPQ
ncbi:ABC transporter substrate-binding protein [Gorillibacterium massiliense]|uniref:ABC transporter substrate-binding protein n=1 Tax=Gorillibacterium massiliense TaxID=1280390 RepID=UPI0004B64BFC|nr:sugar ABC transporter substrate-binding protein [Gorillibacterium massiliense]